MRKIQQTKYDLLGDLELTKSVVPQYCGIKGRSAFSVSLLIMLISKEFFDKLSPSYQVLIKELDDIIAKRNAEDASTLATVISWRENVILINAIEQRNIMEEFFGNYMMPKEYWQYYESLFNMEVYDREEMSPVKERNWKAYQQFYYDRSFGQLKNPETGSFSYPKLLEFVGEEQEKEHITSNKEENLDFLYPHCFLKECFQCYESRACMFFDTELMSIPGMEQTSTPPSKELILKYQKMKTFYQKIEAVEDNFEEWIKTLNEVGDWDFVIQNIENRLGSNLLNKELWKLYIKFLETHDTDKMLQTYSKYCRFFLDDFEMKEEYKAKAQAYGPPFVHWKNLFDFEKQAERISNGFVLPESYYAPILENYTPVPLAIDENVFINFSQNYQNQMFPFQKPFMEYISVNANPAVWRKLHQTCKYFFAKKPYPLCHRLQIKGGVSSFIHESLELTFTNNNDLDIYLKNTWITTCIFCNFHQNLPNNFISTSLLPRLYQCDAKYITIWNQIFTFDELKFLIGSGNVVKLNLATVRVKDEKNEWVELEKIMELLPNIEQLQLSNVKVNKNTATILATQNFNSKINTIKLLDIFGEPFDTTEFLNFCTKNRDENLFLRMEFKPHHNSGIGHEFITNFRKFMVDSNDLEKTHVEINFTPM